MLAPSEVLDLLRGLRAHPEHPFRCGYAVVEGAKAVQQLLRSARPVAGIVCTLDLAISKTAVIVTEAELSALLGFRAHSPIIALTPVPDTVEYHNMKFPAVSLQAVSDAANVGAIVRSAVALGVSTIITDAATSSPFLRRSVRTSMGTCFHIDHVAALDLPSLFHDLAAEGRRTLVLEQTPHSIPILGVVGGVDVLCVGNEGSGCTEQLLASAGVVAHIPMSGVGISLNVAAAAAIGMHSVWRGVG